MYSQDITPPDTPELLYVTVINNDQVYIKWNPSDSADTQGYIIFKNILNWEPIDTVYGINTTDYTELNSGANYESKKYRIAAFDDNDNVSPMTDINEYHNTIYVFPFQVRQNCKDRIKLSYNAYRTWDNIAGYKIYRDVDYSGNFTVIDTAAGTSVVYYDDNISDNHSYCYYVEAFHIDGRTSRSNLTCKLVELPDSFKYINADYATVTGENALSLSFTINNGSPYVKKYKLLSSNDLNGQYEIINEFNAGDFQKITYTDYFNVSSERKFYKLSAYNECDQVVGSSNIASNIILTTSGDTSLIHHLTWNDYEDWLGDVDRYEIYKIDENNNSSFVTTTYTSGSYSLDIEPLVFEEVQNEYVIKTVSGNFCYYIEAVESNSNPYGIIGKSRSNISCIQEDVHCTIPNAFTPDNNGQNDVFKPYVLFSDPQKYTFIVYDRWGEPIFKTHDPNEGWKGRKNDESFKEGTYAYSLEYSSVDGKVFKKRGIFHLIMP